VVVLLLFC